MIRNIFSLLVALILFDTAVDTTKAEDAPQSQGPASYPAEMNKKFTDPNTDIQEYVKRFENEARDIYVKRKDINYKMSFDRLRSQLTGIDAWLLVLDTKGVNVWCAAGKGTFSTDEIVGRVRANRLGEIISHRTLIVPQLGAPGVAAHQVKNRCGFRVV